MSRDPLEELFGPLDSDDTETGAIETDEIAAAGDADSEAATRAFEPAPPVTARAEQVPAVTRPAATEASPKSPFEHILPAPKPVPAASPTGQLAGQQAGQPAGARAQRQERDEPPTRPVPAAKKRSTPALPWIIVGAVAVLALGGAFLVVKAISGDDAKPEATTEAPAPTTSAPSGEESEAPEPTPEEPEEPKAPTADVGPNPISMDISYAGISVESSQKLTNPLWFYQAGPPERVMFESGLMNSFPDACAAMRSPVGQSPWGIEKGEDGTWTVVRPAGTCSADSKLYDEVWGLMQAVADSAKPL